MYILKWSVGRVSSQTITRSSAIAEGTRRACQYRYLATTKHPIRKRLQLTNDPKVYTPKVITIAAFR